jgi:hypothetical protein
VRPQITGDHKVKFKCELLALKDQLGGVRRSFSHNVEFPISHAHIEFPPSMDVWTRIFPVWRKLKREQDDVVDTPRRARPPLRRQPAALGRRAVLGLDWAQPETGKGLQGHHRLRTRFPLRRFRHAPRAPHCTGFMTFETDSQ